jgi:hypothetical protein
MAAVNDSTVQLFKLGRTSVFEVVIAMPSAGDVIQISF